MAESDNAALIKELELSLVVNYVGQATIVLVIYDYLITFRAEVNLFWRKEVNGATILFFLNRYVVLFYHISLLWGWLKVFNSSLHACVPYLYIVRVVTVLTYVPWAGFSALRVFALSNGNYFLGVLVFVLSMIPVAINSAIFHWLAPLVDPVFGCTWTDSTPANISMMSLFTSRGSLIAADLIVIIVTLFTTFKTARMMRMVFGRKQMSLTSLMLQDGLIYFILMLTVNTLHLVCSLSSFSPAFQIADQATRGAISFIPVFSKPLTGILVWRFMLDLQEAARSRTGSTGVSHASQLNTWASSLHFDHRVVGSIGESLGPNIHAESGGMASEELEIAQELGEPIVSMKHDQTWIQGEDEAEV